MDYDVSANLRLAKNLWSRTHHHAASIACASSFLATFRFAATAIGSSYPDLQFHGGVSVTVDNIHSLYGLGDTVHSYFYRLRLTASPAFREKPRVEAAKNIMLRLGIRSGAATGLCASIMLIATLTSWIYENPIMGMPLWSGDPGLCQD